MPHRPRISVINNDPDFLAMVGDVLTDEHYAVTLIDADHADPVRGIIESHPDLLIVDLRLGSEELLGWEALQSVRSMGGFESLPVVVCSGDTVAIHDLEDDIAAMPRVAILQKPFSLDQLDRTVSDLLSA